MDTYNYVTRTVMSYCIPLALAHIHFYLYLILMVVVLHLQTLLHHHCLLHLHHQFPYKNNLIPKLRYQVHCTYIKSTYCIQCMYGPYSAKIRSTAVYVGGLQLLGQAVNSLLIIQLDLTRCVRWSVAR